MPEERFGLKPEVIEKIQQVFSHYPDIDQAVLYGSRAKGNYRPGSDIDLTLKISAATEANLLFRVIGELDELNLPYGFDISLFDQIDNPKLVEHIQRVGVVFYDAGQYRAEQSRRKARQDYARSAYQSEAQLEEQLVKRLAGLGYARVAIANAEELRANLKKQLEVHNNIQLSDAEFAKVLNHLDKGNVFQRAKTLRDRFQFTRDDGTACWIQFLNTEHWCQNQYQVTHQVTVEGKYQNRYDVTLLVNGLPLVQIELKRRGVELKKAFNQINRYQRHSFWAESGLYQYVQLFVISNGVNTRYYANNRKQDYKQTFTWSDVANNAIQDLDHFADVFLEKCHLSKMICKYIVLHESDRILMVLRPYQFYAVEAIVGRVLQAGQGEEKVPTQGGYVWHTTGSGKTLTSFKAAQTLTRLPKVDKVVFVVDRADLDYQTTKEFNYFSPGSVDGTDNTKALVKQMADDKHSLIITTIQKLNTAITRPKHSAAMEGLRGKRVVFIFDECHRSQFGDTHRHIVGYFHNAQLFGFTGTPIFEPNAVPNKFGKRTTAQLFGPQLHRYLITNAIADENVLKFSVEYWGKLKKKDGSLVDEQVAGIDKKAFFENDQRIDGIVDWVITNHERKTHHRQFSAMMCVGSVEALIKYYEAFRRKKEAGGHSLRVVTIFTYDANEDDADANGLLDDPDFDIRTDDPRTKHSRESLEAFVADYNALYGTNQSVKDTKAFYTYYRDIARRIKERDREGFDDKDRVDILLVVNMYLTGFDAKKVNTLYVDKNLRYHGLIQAYSRTNRTLGELKSQGNIICFRNLKAATDEAITLFSDKDAKETILVEPYERHVEVFNADVLKLRLIAETPQAVDDLIREDDQANFVRAFRRLTRTLNVLRSFTEFTWMDLDLSEQEFEDYKSKYLDIYDRSRNEEQGASIIEEVDFELELIQRDEINVAYILDLLIALKRKEQEKGKKAASEADQQRSAILDMLGKETQLRSKRELIEKFIREEMPQIPSGDDVKAGFVEFWSQEKRSAVEALCDAEDMVDEAVYAMIDEYHFTGREPLRETVFNALRAKPKLMERKSIYERVVGNLLKLIKTFDDDMGDV